MQFPIELYPSENPDQEKIYKIFPLLDPKLPYLKKDSTKQSQT